MSALSRVRQFGDLRQSRSAKKDVLSSSSSQRAIQFTPKQVRKNSEKLSTATQSEYICIDCQNKQLSDQKNKAKCQAKERQKAIEAENDRLRLKELARLAQHKERDDEQKKRKLLQVNRKMIDLHSVEKERQREMNRSRITIDDNLQQQALEREAAKRISLRDSLRRQIEQKKNRDKQQKIVDKYSQPQNDKNQDGYALLKEKQERYKKDLARQVKEVQDRKAAERYNKFQEEAKQAKLVSELIEREREVFDKQQQRKIAYMKEIKQLQKMNEMKKIEAHRKLQQQRVEALIKRQFEEKQMKNKEKQKISALDAYKRTIQGQIKENERIKLQQKIKQKNNSNSSFNLTAAELERRLCGSCQKSYLKKYLTKLKK